MKNTKLLRRKASTRLTDVGEQVFDALQGDSPRSRSFSEHIAEETASFPSAILEKHQASQRDERVVRAATNPAPAPVSDEDRAALESLGFMKPESESRHVENRNGVSILSDISESESEPESPARAETKARRRYSIEQKEEALALWREGKKYRAIEEAVSIPIATISRWVRAEKGSEGSKCPGTDTGQMTGIAEFDGTVEPQEDERESREKYLRRELDRREIAYDKLEESSRGDRAYAERDSERLAIYEGHDSSWLEAVSHLTKHRFVRSWNKLTRYLSRYVGLSADNTEFPF